MASDLLNKQLADTLYTPLDGPFIVFETSTTASTSIPFSQTQATINLGIDQAQPYASMVNDVITILVAGTYVIRAQFNFFMDSVTVGNGRYGAAPIVNGNTITSAGGEPNLRTFETTVPDEYHWPLVLNFEHTFAVNDTLYFQGYYTNNGGTPVVSIEPQDLSTTILGPVSYPDNIPSASVQLATNL